MANEIRDAINSVWADGPSSKPDEPFKSRIRNEVGGAIQTAVDSLTTRVTVAEDAVADIPDLQADTATALANSQTALDTAQAGIKPDSQVVRLLATANVAIASALENGDTLDGETLAAGDRVALTGQTAPAENGVYVVQASGAAVRAADFDSSDEILRSRFTVTAGTHAGEAWTVQNTSAITVGTTAITIKMTTPSNPTSAEVLAARGDEDSVGDNIAIRPLQTTLASRVSDLDVIFLDSGGRQIGAVVNVDSVRRAVSQSDDLLPRVISLEESGDPELASRVDVSLDDNGALKVPFYNPLGQRELRSKLHRLEHEASSGVIAIMAVIGDSWTHQWARWIGLYTEWMWAKYGYGGIGYGGFGWFGTASGTWAIGGSQPIGCDSNYSASTYYGNPYSLTDFEGAWTAVYNSSSVKGPSPSKATTTANGALLRMTITKETDDITLYFDSDAGAKVQVSFDDGSTYGSDIAVGGWGHVALTMPDVSGRDFDANPLKVRIKNTSSNGVKLGLCGRDLQWNSGDGGVRIHKLACSGGNTTQLAGMDSEAYIASLEALGVDHVKILHGTNDQTRPAGVSPYVNAANTGISASLHATNLATLATRLRSAAAHCDVVFMTPFENQAVNTIPMADYATAARLAAIGINRAGHATLQYAAGTDPSEYAHLMTEPGTDGGIHPLPPSYLLAAAIYDFDHAS